MIYFISNAILVKKIKKYENSKIGSVGPNARIRVIHKRALCRVNCFHNFPMFLFILIIIFFLIIIFLNNRRMYIYSFYLSGSLAYCDEVTGPDSNRMALFLSQSAMRGCTTAVGCTRWQPIAYSWSANSAS